MDLRIAVRNDRDLGYGGVLKIGAVKSRDRGAVLANREDVAQALDALARATRDGQLDYLWKE